MVRTAGYTLSYILVISFSGKHVLPHPEIGVGKEDNMDDNETKIAVLYGRIIVACLAILVATWQLDVDLPVI